MPSISKFTLYTPNEACKNSSYDHDKSLHNFITYAQK